MLAEKMEAIFQLNLEAIQLLQNDLQSSFLDAYVENVDNILDDYQVRVIDGVPTAETVNHLQEIYQQLKAETLADEERRKLSQLLLLKGAQTEYLQPNHQLTPDGLGFLFVYLVEQLYPNKKAPLSVLDLSVGMGNLLFTVLTNLKLAGYEAIEGIGVDNDETLLTISAANSRWLNQTAQLYHQDGLQELLINPVDVAISDLPVGYYPIDENAQRFLSSAEDTHSYAHHLLMEQAMKYVKDDGFGVFLLPANFLETEQSEYLKKWLGKKVHLQGIIQLPDELFKNEHSRKSILIVQNRTENTSQVPQVLLAKLSSLKDTQKVATFFKQFAEWKASNLPS